MNLLPEDTTDEQLLNTVAAKIPHYQPHKPRLYLVHVQVRDFRKRTAVMDACALPSALFVTLTHPTLSLEGAGHSVVARALLVMVGQFVAALGKLRGGVRYAFRLCTRTQTGKWWGHVHGLVLNTTAERLEIVSARVGLRAHIEQPADFIAVAFYIMSSAQSKHWDKAPGRTFWASRGLA